MEENPDANLVLSRTFFDELWPLILDENICDTKSKHHCTYFVPERRFDNMWAHELLSSRGFEDYEPPVLFKCKPRCQNAPAIPIEETTHQKEQINEKETPKTTSANTSKILPKTLKTKVRNLEQAHEYRFALQHNFLNRKFPWYIPRPSYARDLKITDDLCKEFGGTFELEILRSIAKHNCKLLIINVHMEYCLADIQRWMKFHRFAKVITVAHCPEMLRKLRVLNQYFHVIYVPDEPNLSGQEALTKSLNIAVKAAKERRFLETYDNAFIYVFSYQEGQCFCETFRVLRKH